MCIDLLIISGLEMAPHLSQAPGTAVLVSPPLSAAWLTVTLKQHSA